MGWADVERLLARTVGDLIALVQAVRSVGQHPRRLTAMREELEQLHGRVRARRGEGKR